LAIPRVCCAVLLLMLGCSTASAADVVLQAGASCRSASCHAGIAAGGINHVDTDNGSSCTVCHAPTTPTSHEFQFAETGAALCTRCHEGLLDGSSVQPLAALGLCTTCHRMHRAEHPNQLQASADTLCPSCHLKTGSREGRIAHLPAAQGQCLMCHDPHSSNNPKQLVEPVPELCFQCHDKEQRDEDGTRLPAVKPLFEGNLNKHPSFARGQCLLCHEAHDSENYRLQKEPYPEGMYAKFTPETYFCVNCHGLKTFTEPRTLTETQFRNGNLNLHFRHVDKEKGRSCSACHHHHASDRDSLITHRVEFGNRYIEIMEFSRTETGGSCSPSCHKTMRYDRVEPVENALLVTQRTGVDATPEELKQSPEPLDGAAIFEKRCVGCHGIGAAGKVGPNIVGASADRIRGALQSNPMMWVLRSLSNREVEAVAQFLARGPVFSLRTEHAEALDGHTLFETICAGCHGLDAKGAYAPEIRGKSSEQIKEAIGRVPEMSVLVALTESEIEEIADVLPSRPELATTLPAGQAPTTGTDAEALFATRCAGCHGPGAGGGLNGLAPRIVGAPADLIRDAISRVDMMSPLASLTDAEIMGLSAHLERLAIDRGGLGERLFGERCAACHGAEAHGGLAGLAPDINGASSERIQQAIQRVPMMAPLGTLAAEDIEAVARYLTE
jgi:predicted CXXCH cytochrome family protein